MESKYNKWIRKMKVDVNFLIFYELKLEITLLMIDMLLLWKTVPTTMIRGIFSWGEKVKVIKHSTKILLS